MRGELVLATQREPDFFGLYTLQRAIAEPWVLEGTRGLEVMGTVLVRDGWLEQKACRVGYLGDLRARFSSGRGLARFYGPLLEETAQRLGVDVFLTSVMASNAAALQALVRRRARRVSQPNYTLLRRFSAVSVHFTRRRAPPRAPRFQVRRATAGDVPALAALLDADHRTRPFGYRYDTGELEHRLAHWPGLRVEDCYLAHDSDGTLVGCTSAWDPSAVKRYRVLAYRGSMRWVKWGSDVLAPLGLVPRLPAAGECLRSFYLCNTSIRDEDPAILRALVERVYADHHGQGYHFFSLYLEDAGEALAPALEGFFQRRLPFHLYAVTPASHPREHFPSGRTGFEMALA